MSRGDVKLDGVEALERRLKTLEFKVAAKGGQNFGRATLEAEMKNGFPKKPGAS